MKKYRVTLEPDVEYIEVIVEAENPEEAKEKAEDMFSNGEVEFPDTDLSGMDTATARDVEEIKE
jgi:hypothetical protein